MIKASIDRRPHLAYNKKPLSKKSYADRVDTVSDRREAKKPELSVLIVAYNEGADCVALIDKLLSLSSTAEIILVDNGLDSKTAASLLERRICYIKSSSNLGPSAGRNIAATYAKSDIIALLDADGDVEDNFFEVSAKIMSDSSVIAARGKVISPGSALYKPAHYDLGDKQIHRKPDTEGILLFRLKDFMKVGGFEDSLYAGEGVVLCYRMIESYGYKTTDFIYSPDLILYHDYADGKKLIEKARRNTINQHHINTFYPLLDSTLKPISKGNIEQKGYHKVKSATAKIKKEAVSEINNSYLDKGARRWETGVKVTPKKPKFSVILPCYNLGELAVDAVKSVMSQSLSDIEVIVVDDVSTDENTKKALKDLESHVNVIYRKKNGGASAARNTGVAAAKADYILCLDSDDTISHTYLEEAYNIFENMKDVDIVSCHVNIWGGRKGTWRPVDRISLEESLISSPIPNASCYRKSSWKKAGGYDEKLRGMEDWEFWISSLSAGAKIRVIPRLHYNYYVRPGSKVNTSNKNAVEIVSYIVSKHRKAFEANLEFQIAKRHRLLLAEKEKTRKLEDKLLARRGIKGRLLGGRQHLMPSDIPGRVKRGAKVVFVDRDMNHLRETLSYYKSRLR